MTSVRYGKLPPWLAVGGFRSGVFLGILLASVLLPVSVAAEEGSMVVAVRVAPPFVIAAPEPAQGRPYVGVAIELFEEIAESEGWRYRYEATSVPELIDGLANGQYQVGLGALTVNAEREQRIDFSHPILSTGLVAAVRTDDVAGWQSVLTALSTPAFTRLAGLMVALMLLVGGLIWLAERRRNPAQFGGKAIEGVGSGFWFAAVTLTTVGYGDKAPVTLPGRMLSLLWMMAGLVLASVFTATVTSALTVGQLSQRIERVEDLADKRLLAIADTTSSSWLERRGWAARAMPDVQTALATLAAGEADALVYDEPLLRWHLDQGHAGSLRILPLILERQDYALALAPGDPRREAINRGLLQRFDEARWGSRLARLTQDASD